MIHSLLLSGLTVLPTLLPTSPLETLDVSNCSLSTIHESFFRAGIRLNLSNNKIRELPRKETLDYLNGGGNFVGQDYECSKNGIDLKFNPLVYPPEHVYKEGKDRVITYLTQYENTLINPNDITVHLIGNEEVGKTSFGRALSGKITTASEITYRTQCFDNYTTQVGGIKVNIQDLGGQKEYEASIPVVCSFEFLVSPLRGRNDLSRRVKN